MKKGSCVLDNEPGHMSTSQDGSFARPARRLRFGAFEVDLDERELRNRGVRIHIQKKPFQILELLLQKRGALVTRTELAEYLWPGLHVSVDPGLNTAINLLRQTLGDSSSASRFIETRPGLGYRFLASVEELPETAYERPAFRSPANLEALQDYRKGRYLQNKLTEADLGKSIAHFEAAIARDPKYAPAYAGLADTYCLFAFRGMLAPAEARRRAEKLARISLEIDRQLAEPHISLAVIHTIFDWDYKAAEKEYVRGLELNPASTDGPRAYAAFLSAMGRPAEALKEIRTAQELDPLSPGLNVEMTRLYYMARDFQECIQQAWQTLVLEPALAPAQHLLGLAYEQLEMYDEAITELQNAQINSEEDSALTAALGHAYALAGRPDEAWKMLHKLDDLSRRRYVSAYWRSIVYAGLGEKNLAVEELEAAFRDRDVWIIWLKVDPRFDPLRGDSRFDSALAAELKLCAG